MATVNVYLTFNGNCEEVFDFYKSVFGGEYTYIGRFKDMSGENGNSCPPGDAEKIMHVSLPVSKETILMGSDTSESFPQTVTQGNNFSISINTASTEEADTLFNGLSAGGQVIMAMNTTFWGAYFGMFTDKFGINWMVNYDTNEMK